MFSGLNIWRVVKRTGAHDIPPRMSRPHLQEVRTAGNGKICAVCGQPIGDPEGRENVYVIRHVTLMDGRTGWIPVHVRCIRGPWPSLAERMALGMPPGRPLQLTMIGD